MEVADITVTCTGKRGIINEKLAKYIKNKAVLCNMSAVEDEISFDGLKAKYDLDFIEKFEIGSKCFYLVSRGYAINLALGYGTAIEVMDRTFAAAVYSLEYVMKNEFSGLIDLPKEVEEKVLKILEI